jgi:hypothetical protein
MFELERRLKQVGVQSSGSVEPHQSLRRAQALQSAIADESPNNRAVLLLDPSLVVLAVGARPGDLQTVLPAQVTTGSFMTRPSLSTSNVDGAQWKREQRPCASDRFHDERAITRNQRRAPCPGGGEKPVADSSNRRTCAPALSDVQPS